MFLPAAAFLGAVVAYGRRIFSSTEIQVGPQEIGEFAFHNGVLLSHQQYLYGVSEIGEPFIVGKKLAGEDYSAWEAGYQKFPRLRSLTFANSRLGSTWSWSFEAPEACTRSNLLQPMLWLAFGFLCAFLLGYAIRQIVKSFQRVKRNKENEDFLANPSDDIDAEHAKLNCLWRSTLIGMYREQQRELESLKEKLDTQTARAQGLDSHKRRVESENQTVQETVKDLEEQIRALQADKKASIEEDCQSESGEDVLSDAGDAGDILATDGLDGVLTMGEGTKKKKKIRQNKKRRIAKRAAAEETAREVDQAPSTPLEDTEECEENQGEANEVESEASDPAETGLGAASNASKKKRRRRKGRKHEVMDHARNDFDHEPDKLAEDSQHGSVTKKTGKDINDQEEKIVANGMDSQEQRLPLDDGQGERLVAIGEVDQKQKKKRRRKPRSFLSNIMLGAWQSEDAQAQQLPIVDGQSEHLFTLGGDRRPVIRLPMEPAVGRTQINGRTSPFALFREQNDHASNANPSQHDETQDGGDYQRLKNSLDESALKKVQTKNGAISDAPFGHRDSPIESSHPGQFQGQAPFETPDCINISGRMPRVSASPYSQRFYKYPDQGTTDCTQRPIYLGPGVEPSSLVVQSTSTPGTSDYPTSWQPVDSFP